METYKESPWVLLVMMPEQWPIARIFAKYVNTFIYTMNNKDLSRVKLINYSGKALNKFFRGRGLSISSRIFRLGKRKLKFTYRQLPDPNFIDLIFVLDPCRVNIDFSPFKNAVKAYWSQDCIHPSDYYAQVLAGVLDYDVVFCAHKQYMHRFNRTKVCWLPYACDPYLHRRINQPLRYDLAFVGHIPSPKSRIGRERRKLLLSIGELASKKVFIGNAWQHDMVALYNSSKLVLDISRSKELNWRVFEVLGCGRPLLTDYREEVADIFKNREHLAFYSSFEELTELIEYYLTNDAEREEMARKGQEECYRAHTLDHRVKTILEETIGFKIDVETVQKD